MCGVFLRTRPTVSDLDPPRTASPFTDCSRSLLWVRRRNWSLAAASTTASFCRYAAAVCGNDPHFVADGTHDATALRL